MARRKRHEEHEHHEAWAIPYGDLVTLLLAFFVVMYSMSEVNDGKYRVLSNSLSEAFGGTPHATSGNAFSTTLKPIELTLPDEQVRGMIAAGLPDHHLLAGAAALVAGAASGSCAAVCSDCAAAGDAVPTICALAAGTAARRCSACTAGGDSCATPLSNRMSVLMSTAIQLP